MNIPVYFALPDSTRAQIPSSINLSDLLIDFRHPDSMKLKDSVGLRIVMAKRAGMAKRLGQSGLIQTGDILLTFRTEWGGAGAYPNVQMGISHTGLAYVKDGMLHNLDNPLDDEYNGPGMRADLTSSHYRTLDYIHVVRPRNLTDKQRSNILGWATRLNKGAKKIYPKQLSFNQDYNAPKIKTEKYNFVKKVGQMALNQSTPGSLDLYCSEFVWAVLALRDCDPETSNADFSGSKQPKCIKPVMKPMKAVGNVISRTSNSAPAGLADGPLMVIDSLGLPKDERRKLIESVFVNNPKGLAKMSVGHRTVAETMQPKFEKLQTYYLGVGGGLTERVAASAIGFGFRRAIPENYSPTSFLVNTLLPPKNSNRTMDYVATIMIQ